jgi:hypothetical protein
VSTVSSPVDTKAGRAASDAGYLMGRRRGIAAALVLAVLSVLEFIIAKEVSDPTWWMVPFMVLKGALILEIFMHVSDLKKKGAH